MANPKLTVESFPGGNSEVRFSAITGISPGKLDRAFLQSRRELKRLCIVAGVEAARRKAEAKAEKEEVDERASQAEAPTETEAEEVIEEVIASAQEEQEAEEESTA